MTKADLLEVINDFGDDTEIKVNDKEIKENKDYTHYLYLPQWT